MSFTTFCSNRSSVFSNIKRTQYNKEDERHSEEWWWRRPGCGGEHSPVADSDEPWDNSAFNVSFRECCRLVLMFDDVSPAAFLYFWYHEYDRLLLKFVVQLQEHTAVQLLFFHAIPLSCLLPSPSHFNSSLSHHIIPLSYQQQKCSRHKWYRRPRRTHRSSTPSASSCRSSIHRVPAIQSGDQLVWVHQSPHNWAPYEWSYVRLPRSARASPCRERRSRATGTCLRRPKCTSHTNCSFHIPQIYVVFAFKFTTYGAELGINLNDISITFSLALSSMIIKCSDSDQLI